MTASVRDASESYVVCGGVELHDPRLFFELLIAVLDPAELTHDLTEYK